MAPSKKAAAAKKAAATRAAKKEAAAAAAAGSVVEQQEVEQEQEQEQPEQAREAAEAGASEQPEDSKAGDTAQSTRKSRRGAAGAAGAPAAAPASAPTRTSRRGKAADAAAETQTELEPKGEDEPQSVNKMQQPATTASVTEGKPPVAAADAKPAKAPASKAAPAADMVAESSNAGSTSLPDSPVATTSTHGHSMVDSVMTAASGAPDILGVVEAREDEDLAVDDTEPPPMDREEERRLRERPASAHVSAQAMPPLAQSGSMPRAQQATASRMQAQLEERREVHEPIGQLAGIQEPQSSGDAQGEEADGGASLPGSREDRMARMNALRKRMNDSAQANRREVIAAQNEHRAAIAESKRLERKRKQAEAMGEKLDALETGEDLERKRNWEYSLEDNERWTKKQDRKERRADHGFKDFDESARRKYKRDIDTFKPDLEAYRKQREAAIEYGLAVEGSTSSMAIEGPSGSGSREVVQGSSTGGQMIPGGELLYRDASSFVYADHKPSDDAIDRVVGQINQDIDKRSKRSRVRVEDDSDITYINDKNKVFNKKLERYFNKYTSEIKNNFERGTAL